jgi:hypothetical protein
MSKTSTSKRSAVAIHAVDEARRAFESSSRYVHDAVNRLLDDKQRLDWLETNGFTLHCRAQGMDHKSVWNDNVCVGDGDGERTWRIVNV